jgi:hypothetical protein
MDTNTKQYTKILICSFLALIALIYAGAANAATQSSVSFVGADSVSEGNWQAKYGADGYSIANGLQNLPAYASFTPQNQLNWTWSTSTSDPRALQVPNANGRAATTWFSQSAFSFDVNLTDGNSHQVAIYALDWDSQNRAETIQIVDANSGSVLDTHSIFNFTSGMYLVWNVTGHVKVNVTYTSGSNAVASAIFFGGAANSVVPATVSFVNADTTTEGNWVGKYGSNGYSIPVNATNVPSYATFTPQNQQTWTWTSASNDPRVLQSSSGAQAPATCWFSNSSFGFDVNFTDGKSHQFALYALDWDNRGRTETVQIVDANSGATLDTRTLANFNNGTFLVWNISGHVTVTVVATAGPNVVLSGAFFGGATSTSNPTPAAPAVGAQPASTYILNASSTSVSFGSVNVSSSTQQTVTLTNAGTANVTVSNVSVSGAGFNASGVSTGTILSPGQSVTLTAIFAPAATGSATGSISVTSNATNGTKVVALSGTGAAATHSLELSWSPSTSSVAGYNVYVSTVSGSSYVKLTSSPVANASYTDAGIQTAQTRYYVVTSVDSNNNESAYSNQVSALIP